MANAASDSMPSSTVYGDSRIDTKALRIRGYEYLDSCRVFTFGYYVRYFSSCVWTTDMLVRRIQSCKSTTSPLPKMLK